MRVANSFFLGLVVGMAGGKYRELRHSAIALRSSPFKAPIADPDEETDVSIGRPSAVCGNPVINQSGAVDQSVLIAPRALASILIQGPDEDSSSGWRLRAAGDRTKMS